MVTAGKSRLTVNQVGTHSVVGSIPTWGALGWEGKKGVIFLSKKSKSLSKAAKTLASPSSSKKEKSAAGSKLGKA